MPERGGLSRTAPAARSRPSCRPGSSAGDRRSTRSGTGHRPAAVGTGDLPLLRRLLGEPALTADLGGPETADQIERRHECYLATNDPATGLLFAIVLPPGTAVASVGYWERDEDGETAWETGWFVLPEYQGRGIATAATPLAVEAAWTAIARPVHAYPNLENVASNTIAQNAGLRLIGPWELE
ncbi:MAG TPA: GNAT family N-acetyltransferase, partial [Candidatus Limnocylindrales bacterium]|nr:GNAT family N-acetyltransferase [Candidatus Limnocylindrales bacterium]